MRKDIKIGDIVYYIKGNQVYAGLVQSILLTGVKVNDTKIDNPFIYKDKKTADLTLLEETAVSVNTIASDMYNKICDRNSSIIEVLDILPEGINSVTHCVKGVVHYKSMKFEYNNIKIVRDNDESCGYVVCFISADGDILKINSDDRYTVNLDAMISLNSHLENLVQKYRIDMM